MSKQYDAVVIGGGAAGLMCAWQAGLRGRRVVVLERSKKVGRKILMSGGGRCNFTNLYVEPDNFISQNPHFVKSALSQYTQWDFISSVVEHDVAYHERDHGQLFCDDKAKDIVNLLLDECEKVNVDIVLQCDVQSVEELKELSSTSGTNGYSLKTSKGVFVAPSLVVATGGLSIPYMDPTPYGYELAKQFGLNLIPVRASLVPYTFTGALRDMFAKLSGVAIPVTIESGKHAFTEAMLFTHRGLSGPSVLQISNYWETGNAVTVDVIPDKTMADELIQAKASQARSLLRTVLSKWLPKNLVAEFETIWWPERAELPISDWPDKELVRLGELLNRWQIVPSGTEGYRTAEVTLGGVDTNDLSSSDMQARNQPGLFFIGEVVDVTGHLGGFNFQWAWSSAYACAQAV